MDLRLVPAAATVWALTLAAPSLPVGVLGGCAVGCAGAAAFLLRGGAGRSPRWSGRRAIAVGCLAAAIAVSAAAAVRAADRATSPLPELAELGAVVPVVVELADDPRPLAGAGGPRVLVAADVREVSGAEVPAGSVLVFGPAEEWVGLLPGQSVWLRAAVRPAEDGDTLLAVLSARSPPIPVAGPGPVQEAAGTLRAGLVGAADRALEPRPAGLLPGLVVGDTRAMDPVLTAEFRRAGLAHLTAVSGANVAIAIALVLWPLRRYGVDRRVQAAVGLLALAGFVVLARPGASVLRAGAMAVVVLVALAWGRSRAAVPALAAAVCVLLLVEPDLAREGGFVLSVAATAAIVLVARPWSRALRQRGVPRPAADALAVSAAAGLATAPLVAALSGVVSLVSLPANLLAAPAVAPATVLGLLAAVVSPVAPPLATALAWLAGWPVRWLVLVAERAAAVPDGATGWPAGLPGAALLTVVLAAVVTALVRWPRLRPLALAALLGAVLLGWPLRQATRGWPPGATLLVACDVGQGDALVLPTAPGEAVLVDAGPDPGLVDGCLTRLGIERLPLVLLSHLDADHAGGLTGALAGREIGDIATGTLSPADERAAAFTRTVHAVGSRHVVLRPGEHRTVGGLHLEVIAPQPAAATVSAESNDLSLVVRASQRGVRVLLTGDLGAEAERRIIASGADLRADVLKVPHHGSADADREFLAATGARVALVSVGADNTYGHPTDRLLDWLAADGMRVHRTDRQGDLAVVGSAGNWGVAVRGVDAVLRATASAELLPGVVARGPAGPRREPGRSVPRDTMGTWQRHPRNRRPTCGSWWGRRSCCAPARSPPSGPPSARGTLTRRSTSWSPPAWRWARWPTP
ncbi:ComEC/Rec2 family competence protein [Modestobacter lapidis]